MVPIFLARDRSHLLHNGLSPIHLTAGESKLCKLLLAVCESRKLDNVEVRLAGGWVRDKLLGLPSDDIDVALSSMTGAEFAKHCSEYLADCKSEENVKVYHVQTNPEKSKHLATACIKVFDYSVDLVNLRKEDYAADSRIPQADFGTPYEDAMRRDITLNALFYNVHTGDVEDYTKSGLDDLASGIIKTPLAGTATFIDDPLRVLRVVRFAVRFGFTIDDGVQEAMKDPVVIATLANPQKISRERIGIEVAKMLQSKFPVRAIETMHSVGIIQSVFPIEDQSISAESIARLRESALENCQHLYRILKSDVGQSAINLLNEPTLKLLPILYASAYLVPFAHLSDNQNKKSKISYPKHAAAVLLKWNGNDSVAIAQICKSVIEESDKIDTIFTNRLKAGQWIRKCGKWWPAVLVLMLQRVDNAGTKDLEKYLKYIQDQKLENAYSFKPILDGREIMALKPDLKAGPQLADILGRIMQWQLEHQHGTKEDAKEWLQSLE